VFRDLITAIVTIISLGQAAAVVQQPTPGGANTTPGDNATAVNVTPAAAVDPAAIIFTTEIGLVLHAVKPGSVGDYEAALTALQKHFAASSDVEIRKVAAGWRVYKAVDPDQKAALYVHLLQPAIVGVDYRPSLWLDKLLDGAPAEILSKYRDAFAAPPSKLTLAEFAHMAVAPVAAPGNASPATPANATPPRPPGTR
jgi:hypothetical protein